ncbi:MAG: hypothetical protein JW720_14835 [Sedimentisphaerales bacterium]|nr:hypothetical protein [Sedimentisphaerales bacterium]
MNRIFVVLMSVLVLTSADVRENETAKQRIFVVSSYHREYLWSQDTQKGLCAGLLEFGFLDNEDQAIEFTQTDRVETESAIAKKAWMDTKRKSSRGEIMAATIRIMDEISEFSPDIVLLGDDKWNTSNRPAVWKNKEAWTKERSRPQFCTNTLVNQYF